ncbi:reverse transcriptase domain-containing protein [Tanacetum coccineum]
MIKDLLTNKEKLLEIANTPVNENCSAVILKKLPEKLGDTGRFLIPCEFYGLESCMTLADLGASINLMPLSVWKTLSLPELSTTRMTLELATRTVAIPAGIAEDVFVQVGKFTFPADFVVVDYEVDLRVPPILGRPFLRTAHALVDVHGDKLTFNFLLEEIDAFLSLDDLIPPGIDDGTYNSEGDILFLERLLNDDPTPDFPPIPYPVCLINDAKKIKSSIDDPPDLDLKDLPSHLEYAFLEGTSKLPIIIAKDLKREEKEQLLKVLKSHKRAIAWKISDIRGINPNFCTHKILMEDDFKPAVQHQRRTDFLAIFKSQLIPKTKKRPLSPVLMEHLLIDECLLAFAMLLGHSKGKDNFHLSLWNIFMDDFSVFGDSFSSCLSHLDTMLQWCEDTNLVLNWEKCHFMVKEGIVLGHKISKNGLEVDRAKVDVIAKLPPPTTVKGVRSFLGHAGSRESRGDHLSRLENPYQGDHVGMEINDNFLHESLSMISLNPKNKPSWFADIANYLVGNVPIKGMSSQQKKKFFKDI